MREKNQNSKCQKTIYKKGDETQKLKLWQNSKNPIVKKKFKKSNCDSSGSSSNSDIF